MQHCGVAQYVEKADGIISQVPREWPNISGLVFFLFPVFVFAWMMYWAWIRTSDIIERSKNEPRLSLVWNREITTRGNKNEKTVDSCHRWIERSPNESRC